MKTGEKIGGLSRAAIVSELARAGVVEDAVRNIAGRALLSGPLLDLVQDVYCILLDCQADRIVHLWESGQIRYYVARIVLNQYRSTTSPYYARYRRFSARSRPIEGAEDVCPVCRPRCW